MQTSSAISRGILLVIELWFALFKDTEVLNIIRNFVMIKYFE